MNHLVNLKLYYSWFAVIYKIFLIYLLIPIFLLSPVVSDIIGFLVVLSLGLHHLFYKNDPQ